ncbi:Rv0361 family membrane protein [Mycobacterium sp. C3-094]|uniref:Rv0361 family membrane protein n=1 Tax=Mycobacterium sp. PSTR-4-N TaxID=2917745 RepID=UPI001F14E4AA|nr:hypothetical protein [Mycobacterium sp. PSTR-4-N]MCG7595814.1 hypothetical protein [Mycobacterium sp. PSTR-4-N]
MTGPYPPHYGAGPAGPQDYPGGYGQSQPQPYPDAGFAAAYPGALPPPVPYPPRRRRWLAIVAAVVAVLVVAGVVTAIVLTRGSGDSSPSGALTEASARTAIQDYLDALSGGDAETVARHSLCGLFDAVKERRSDLALASLSSDAFRKQYSSAQVTSIDKMVLSSPTQAQVLFTMKVTPQSRSSRNQPADADEQAIAQLVSVDNDVLVCSYLPRTAGQY